MTSNQPGVQAQQPQPATPLVLVVDDSLTVRKITSRLLEREGYRVLTAKDGVDALEQLRELMPDVIISDIEMPRMDGITFLKAVKAMPAYKFTPVIMLTTESQEGKKQEGQAAGAKAWIARANRDGPMGPSPTRRTRQLSRNAGGATVTSSASSSRPSMPTNSKTCAPIPAT